MVSFIILHYKNLNDTLECIESIKKVNGKKSILVVDNNTLSTSEKELIENKVDCLIALDSNIGFAKANNIGVNKSKELYNPDFVCVINNDTLINDKNFINKIEENYKIDNFDMLGTSIESPGDSVNPFPVYKDLDTVNNEIIKTKKLIKIYKSSLLTCLLNIYLKTKYTFNKVNKLENGKERKKNVALHGCAIIFSKKYLDKYEDAFYDGTFLFHEEEFLYQRIIKDGLTSLYDPNMKIYHKEGSSMKKNNKNSRKRKLFREQERLKSLELLKEKMK